MGRWKLLCLHLVVGAGACELCASRRSRVLQRGEHASGQHEARLAGRLAAHDALGVRRILQASKDGNLQMF